MPQLGGAVDASAGLVNKVGVEAESLDGGAMKHVKNLELMEKDMVECKKQLEMKVHV